MSRFINVTFLLLTAGGIVIAIAAGLLAKGMEYASWVSGAIAGLSIAAGLLVRALQRRSDEKAAERSHPSETSSLNSAVKQQSRQGRQSTGDVAQSNNTGVSIANTGNIGGNLSVGESWPANDK